VVELLADCARCVGLCCVAPAFARSADFAVDKPAGTPCTNLRADFRCAIHTELRDRGFAGCTVFDCLGAGQRVTAAFAGRDWRSPEVAPPMFAAFAVARQVHELLWYLDEARVRAPDPALDAEWARLVDEDPAACDVAAARERVGELLRVASERLRTGRRDSPSRERRLAVPKTGTRRTAGPGREYGRADLVGVRWRSADLRRAGFRGALLLGADLLGADLRLADLLGADLRGADLRGADLSTSLFLTPMQAAAARGDDATRLPERVPRPAHWPGRDQP
jgi:Pentapeptide repeats (8 copies)